MKFFIIAALFTTIALAAPAEDNKASTNSESSALSYLLANSPAGMQVAQGGPPPEGCYWDGTAPFCAGGCPTGYAEENRDPCGNGACCWTGIKVLCCKN